MGDGVGYARALVHLEIPFPVHLPHLWSHTFVTYLVNYILYYISYVFSTFYVC